jgi:hypothetical protein
VIELVAHAEGTILSVRARAGARQNGLRGIQAGSLQVHVTQSPEKGKANGSIIAVMAAALELRKNQFELTSGQTSPQKRFLVRGVAPEELTERITAALDALTRKGK